MPSGIDFNDFSDLNTNTHADLGASLPVEPAFGRWGLYCTKYPGFYIKAKILFGTFHLLTC